MNATFLQLAAVMLVAGVYLAARAWVEHARREDERRARAARRIPRQRTDPVGRGIRAGLDVPGYTDPRVEGRR